MKRPDVKSRVPFHGDPKNGRVEHEPLNEREIAS